MKPVTDVKRFFCVGTPIFFIQARHISEAARYTRWRVLSPTGISWRGMPVHPASAAVIKGFLARGQCDPGKSAEGPIRSMPRAGLAIANHEVEVCPKFRPF